MACLESLGARCPMQVGGSIETRAFVNADADTPLSLHAGQQSAEEKAEDRAGPAPCDEKHPW